MYRRLAVLGLIVLFLVINGSSGLAWKPGPLPTPWKDWRPVSRRHHWQRHPEYRDTRVRPILHWPSPCYLDFEPVVIPRSAAASTSTSRPGSSEAPSTSTTAAASGAGTAPAVPASAPPIRPPFTDPPGGPEVSQHHRWDARDHPAR